MTYDERENRLSEMAKFIFDNENDSDGSLVSVYLDEMVCMYTALRGQEFIDMYEYMVKNQIEESAIYGDIDESIKKLKVTGEIGNRPDYAYEASAIYLKDNFCGNNFVVIKVVKTHKKIERFVETEYHIRKIQKELPQSVKSIDIKKYLKWGGDIRDDGYAGSFVIDKYDKSLKMKDMRGMVGSSYQRFQDAYRALRSPYYELSTTEK